MQIGLFEAAELNDLGVSESLNPHKFITDPIYLDLLVDRINKAGTVAFDIETTRLGPQAELVGYGLAWREWDVEKQEFVLVSVYLPIGHVTNLPQIRIDVALNALQRIADSSLVIAHNMGFEMGQMKKYGVTFKKWHDTQYDAHAYDEKNGMRSLKDIAYDYLGLKWGTIKEIAGKKRKGKSSVDIRAQDASIEALGTYCMGDVEATYLLWEWFKGKINHAVKIIPLERAITPVVVKMEERGVRLDLERLDKRLAEVEAEIEEAKGNMFNILGRPFNPGSNPQLAKIFFEELGLQRINGNSTDIEVLETLVGEHPLVDGMMVFREKEKLRNTYLEPLKRLHIRGRIYTSFNQLGPETGRFSSSGGPKADKFGIQMQNQPAPVRNKETGEIDPQKDPGVRQLFIPTEGMVFFDVDYSQIEGRIFAHITQDPILLKYYREGGDIHTATADKLGIPRKLAKSINFAIIYQAYGKKLVEIMLKEGFSYSLKEANDMIKAFWSTYKVAAGWAQGVKDLLQKDKAAYTVLGRRRKFPKATSDDFMDRASAEREAINHNIQGFAADIMKLAMVDVNAALDWTMNSRKEQLAYMLLQVHDELLFEMFPENKEEASNLIIHRMKDAIPLSVELQVEGVFGPTWCDCH